jgi:hypothetical protein
MITTATAIYFELNTMFKAVADRADEYSITKVLF